MNAEIVLRLEQSLGGGMPAELDEQFNAQLDAQRRELANLERLIEAKENQIDALTLALNAVSSAHQDLRKFSDHYAPLLDYILDKSSKARVGFEGVREQYLESRKQVVKSSEEAQKVSADLQVAASKMMDAIEARIARYKSGLSSSAPGTDRKNE